MKRMFVGHVFNFTIVFLMSLVVPLNLYASELNKDEAIVLVGLQDGDGAVKALRFKSVKKNRAIQIKSKHPFSPQTVKAGDFYLKTIFWKFKNVSPTIFKKPKDEGRAYSVQPGVVTYLGDWHFAMKRNLSRPDWDIQHQYSDTTIVEFLEENKELKTLPLFVALENGQVIEYGWEKAIANAKPKEEREKKARTGNHMDSEGMRTYY